MYAQFKDQETGEEHGSFEVFHHDAKLDVMLDDDGDNLPTGWYWWSCFPGCLPDGDLNGPFETEAEALADAQSE